MDLSLIKLCRSANHPADDTSTAGGALAAGPVEITALTVGECLPKLLSPLSGTLDAEAVTQYQASYLHNGNSEVVGSPKVYLRNGVQQLAAPDYLRFVSTSAGDDSTRHLQVWGEVSGVLVSEQVVLSGTTPVQSLQVYTRVFRIRLRANSSGALLPSVGRIDCVALSDGAWVGSLYPGGSVLTAELALGVAASNGNVATWTNRRTAPSGVTFTTPAREEASLSLPADLGASEHCAIYWRETIQPGMPREALMADFQVLVEV